MDLQLADRVYLVTGGSQGLGSATVRVLVSEGARVIVCSRQQDNVEAAVEEFGGQAIGVAADIRDAATPRALVQAAMQTFGRLDGAFISHGGPVPGPASELDDDDLHDALELAVVGPIRMARDVGAALGKGGCIVVLTSTSSVQPYPGLATSNVARPAVWGYVKTLADELGPRAVRVNALLPGRFATNRVIEYEEDLARRHKRPLANIRREAEESIPLQRLGDPLELGRVAAFLLSPAASYVTGTAWQVDGGVTRGL